MHRIPIEEEAFKVWFLSGLGCSTLVLVPALAHEETHHIDMLAQFLSADMIAIASVDATDSPEDAVRMDVAARGFLEAAEVAGMDLRLVSVPLPYLGAREYRTYLNDVRLDTQLMVPAYSDVPAEVEQDAYAILSRSLPDVGIVPIPADEMIRLAGSLHCMAVGMGLPQLRVTPFAGLSSRLR
jgi:agmatine/peptidylarginine deiminase